MVSSTATEILFVKLILCKCWQQGSDRLSLIMEISVEQLFRCFANHLPASADSMSSLVSRAIRSLVRRKVTDKSFLIIYFYQKFGLPTKKTLIKSLHQEITCVKLADGWNRYAGGPKQHDLAQPMVSCRWCSQSWKNSLRHMLTFTNIKFRKLKQNCHWMPSGWLGHGHCRAHREVIIAIFIEKSTESTAGQHLLSKWRWPYLLFVLQ